MKPKLAYISGPISGLINGNFDAFQRAQTKLECEGYIVINPHEIGKDIYDKWAKIKRPDNNIDAREYDKQMWHEFMKHDIKHLVDCDCIFVLDNWETSPGARMELAIAQKLDIKIYYMNDYREFDISFTITKSERVPI